MRMLKLGLIVSCLISFSSAAWAQEDAASDVVSVPDLPAAEDDAAAQAAAPVDRYAPDSIGDAGSGDASTGDASTGEGSVKDAGVSAPGDAAVDRRPYRQLENEAGSCAVVTPARRPSSFALLAATVLALAFARRRRQVKRRPFAAS